MIKPAAVANDVVAYLGSVFLPESRKFPTTVLQAFRARCQPRPGQATLFSMNRRYSAAVLRKRSDRCSLRIFLQLRDGLSKDNRNFRNREPVEEFNGKAGPP
jgi:hypothetical protein